MLMLVFLSGGLDSSLISSLAKNLELILNLIHWVLRKLALMNPVKQNI